MFPASPKQRAQAAARFPDRPATWFRSGSCLDKPLRAVVKRAAVTPVSPHSFRRTMENLARRAGVDDLVRRAQAGWRTESAQAIYATVDKSERTAAGQAVVELVNRAREAQVVRPPGTPEVVTEKGS
jgi:integrase